MPILPILKNLIPVIVFVMIFSCGFYTGSSYVQVKWDMETAKITMLKAAGVTAVAKDKEAAATKALTVVDTFVDKKVDIITKTNTIIKKVPVYVTKKSDDACLIPNSFSLHWNATNQGMSTYFDNPGVIDETPSDIRLSDIATQHAVEASVCKQTEAQLISLQELLRTLRSE